jgi:hypothetical protein
MTTYREWTGARLSVGDGMSGSERKLSRKQRGDVGRFGHGVIDMTGQQIAGVEVIARGPNIAGTACWRCRLPCGCILLVRGTVLRHYEKEHCRVHCRTCDVGVRR